MTDEIELMIPARPGRGPKMPAHVEGTVADVRAAVDAHQRAVAEFKHNAKIQRGEITTMESLGRGGSRCSGCSERFPVLSRGDDGKLRCASCAEAAGMDTSVFEVVRLAAPEIPCPTCAGTGRVTAPKTRAI